MTGQDVEVVYDENGDINQDHILDDYQKNPKGFKDGDLVTIQSEGLKFYHIRKFKVQGVQRLCYMYHMYSIVAGSYLFVFLQ